MPGEIFVPCRKPSMKVCYALNMNYSGKLRDLRMGNLWIKRPFREGFGSWGMAAQEDNGETESFTFCGTGFPAFIYLFNTTQRFIPIHIVFFPMSRAVFRKKVCSDIMRRTGLWFLTQQGSCLARLWLEHLLFFGSHQTCLTLLQWAPEDRELPCQHCASRNPLPLSLRLVHLQIVET